MHTQVALNAQCGRCVELLITAIELKHSQVHVSSGVFWRIQYFVSYIVARCGVSTAAKCQELFFFLCADVHRSLSGEAAVEFVVVLLGSGRTAGPVCSGVVVSCLSAFCRGPQGGHRGDI